MQHFTNIHQFLAQFETDKTVSDFHLCAEEFIVVRRLGELVILNDIPKLSLFQTEILARELLDANARGYQAFLEEKEADFNFYSKAGIPYRVNAYFKRGKIALAMRKIDYNAPSLESIMYADMAQTVRDHVLTKKTGLFLVTGPTGSGKTTSLISMLEWINENRSDHIVTIEDPIEYIYKPKGCLFSQRQLGLDTLSFANATKSALREDPDVILIGEIRDPETAEVAIQLAETGHLVFSTLHTKSASHTLSSFLAFFPPLTQDRVRDRLSDSLLGVQSQFLIMTKDEKQRVALIELMINTPAIRNSIKKEKGSQIESIIQTSRNQGMIPHKEYARRLIEDGVISADEVNWLFETEIEM